MRINIERGDTTVRVNENRKLEIKKRIIQIGNKTGEIVKTSDITNHLIDNYMDEAIKDIISEIEIRKLKKKQKNE